MTLRKPTLRQVDPFKAFVLTLLIGFNLSLGSSLLMGLARTADFFIVNTFFSYYFWGAVFLLLGLLMLVAYLRNNYRQMRIMLITGLFVTLIWSVGLLMRQFENTDTNILLLTFFTLLTLLKFGFLLYFPSPRKVARG